jgi:hypothetical protein
MTKDRMGGLALIAGSVAGIVTMSQHPTAEDLFAPGQLESMASRLILVHALALASLPVLFLGALVLWKRLGSEDGSAIAGLVLYGFATVAVMNAAVFDGLVSASIAPRISAATPTASEGWRIAFMYNGHLNQAFARVFVVASTGAIVLWSVAIIRNETLARALGWYGCVLGPITLVAVFPGHLRLDPHGFGLIVLGQAAWFISAGAQLWRSGTHDSLARSR